MLERMYGITPQEELPPVAPEIPDLSITIQENEEHYGRFVVEPLERGWGVTLGNPLRRSLLNSLPGTAITWVKVVGALHEYSTIAHMREEVVEFLLNIKGIRIRSLSDRPGRLRLEVDGEGEVRAGDIMATADFEIVNPEHHLATLDNADARLSVEFNVEQGVGYEPASQDEGLPIGVLPVDAIFTPVRKANFSVALNPVTREVVLKQTTITQRELDAFLVEMHRAIVKVAPDTKVTIGWIDDLSALVRTRELEDFAGREITNVIGFHVYDVSENPFHPLLIRRENFEVLYGHEREFRITGWGLGGLWNTEEMRRGILSALVDIQDRGFEGVLF